MTSAPDTAPEPAAAEFSQAPDPRASVLESGVQRRFRNAGAPSILKSDLLFRLAQSRNSALQSRFIKLAGDAGGQPGRRGFRAGGGQFVQNAGNDDGLAAHQGAITDAGHFIRFHH